jgi:type I restriction enzyme S subunit
MVDVKLGDVIQVKHGYAFPGDGFAEDPEYPTLVTPGNFAIGGGFKVSSPKTFSGEVPAGYVLQPGSLIVTMTDLSKQGDTLGLPALVPADGMFLHNQRIGLVQVLDPGRVDIRFLAYYLRTAPYRAHILGTASGSTVRHTSPSRIEAFVASLPGLAEQRAIAEVLGALDDKIAANGQVIERADELARLHFDAAPTTAQVALSSLARFVNGKAFTKDATGSGRVVVRIAELNSGIGSSTVYNAIEVSDDHLARPGDLLFAWSGSLTTARWYRSEAIVNQHIFKVVPNTDIPIWLVNQAVRAKLDEFKAIAADKATTMGHIQRRHLDEPVSVPVSDEIHRIDGLMTGLWDAALAAEVESLKLTEIRNELLPLLMSGKVRVRDAGTVLEGAV